MHILHTVAIISVSSSTVLSSPTLMALEVFISLLFLDKSPGMPSEGDIFNTHPRFCLQKHKLQTRSLPPKEFNFHQCQLVFFSSFPYCYAAEFSALHEVGEGQGGVPLEHLITCVPGVNIATTQNGVKVVKWIHNKPPPPNSGEHIFFQMLS